MFDNDHASEADADVPHSADVDGLSRYVVMASWDDCPNLDEDAKRELAGEYLPSQLEARRRGVPSLGAGTIYPVPESDAEAIKARGAWIPGVGDAAAINISDGQQFRLYGASGSYFLIRS